MYKLKRPIILSRHPSHSPLRRKKKERLLELHPFRSIIRFGSTTPTSKYQNVKVEVNTVNAVENSSSKVRMKECFLNNNVKTAEYILARNVNELLEFFNQHEQRPIIAKRRNSSRGRGMRKLDTEQEIRDFCQVEVLNHYIYERFYNYVREYRLHVSSTGCFYACRKVLKNDTPEDAKWFRNDLHCNWIREDGENPELFDKPVNWNQIIEECVKALNAVGLDFGACDVRVQSATGSKGKRRENPDFIIVEINSAPSFGDNEDGNLTYVTKAYIKELPKIIKRKSLT